MKSLFVSLPLLLGVTGLNNAHAAAVVMTETLLLTESGQDFSIVYEDLIDPGTGVVLTISTGGTRYSDTSMFSGLDLADPDEFFALTLDGQLAGTFTCFPGLQGTIEDAILNTFDDCIFSLVVSIAPARFSELIDDGVLDVGLLLSFAVSDLGDGDEIIVSLALDEADAVPLPDAGLLLLAGLASGAFIRARALTAANV